MTARGQLPNVIMPPVLPPDPPERDEPREPDWFDDELPPVVKHTSEQLRDSINAVRTDTSGGFDARLAAAEARISVLSWLACFSLIVTLLTLDYLRG